mgnify:CR=1 FL=1
MSLQAIQIDPGVYRFPRSRGDEPTGKVLDDVHNWFSPLTRG